MSKFFLNKRSWKVIVAFLMVLGFCTVLSACSDDDDLGDPTRASILVTHSIASAKMEATARSLGSDIRSVIYYCYNSQGVRTFGPAQLAKTPQILLQAVPVESTSIGMTYLDGDGKAIAYYSQPVSLKVGEVYEINDPDWKYLNEIDNMEGLEIVQDDMRVHTGDEATFYATALFKDKESGKLYPQLFNTMCDWKSSNTSVASSTKSDESESSSIKGKFYTFNAGTTQISATFQKYTATVTLDVTEATITKVKLSETEVTLPLGLPCYELPLTATWSDGKETDVSYQSNWSTSNGDRVLVSYGYIFPKASHEAEEEPTVITASCTSNGQNHQDQCKVTVVDATYKNKSLSIKVDPEPLYVGDTSFIGVFATFTINGSDKSYEIDDVNYYTVTSSKPEVAAIDFYGMTIEGLAVGTTDLTVNFANGDIKDSAKTTVSVVERGTSDGQVDTDDNTGDATGDNTGDNTGDEGGDEGGDGSDEGQDGGDIDMGGLNGGL